MIEVAKNLKHTLPSPPRLTDSQLWRLVYSNWDFQQALSSLTFLMEECDFQAMYSRVELRKFRCYETSIVVSFARPFEGSRGQTSLGLKAIGVRLTEQESALQAKLIQLRHKVIAHSDEEFMHFRGTIIQSLDDSPLAMPLLQYSESLHLQEADCRPLETLLRMLMGKISEALFAIAQVEPSRLNFYKAPSASSPDA